ncbi:MAG: hypothetical protein N3A53_03845, partial [Verrucomicrobiae bacterium]|nr:hypothetical protein [Verrucomicrobiae bacterium]
NLLADRVRVDYPQALYGMMLDGGLRTVGGEQAGYAECRVTLGEREVHVKAVEFRKAGRAHYIELHVHSPEQKAVLDLLFEQFLSRYKPASGARR